MSVAGRRLGRWVVERELGRGAMGVVLAARDERTGERVALKLVPPGNDLELAARLAREARAAAKVKHPNVVALLDVAELPEGLVLAFELVPGGTLAAKAPLPWREAVLRAAEIAWGLDAIHQVGLVHRDLKPENVLVDADGRAKIADLGLVKGVAGTSLAESRATETGAIVGTPHYMAPEQVDGRATPASDLYALGATLHHLIAGVPPFHGHHGMALLRQHVQGRPPRLRELVPDVPPEVEELVLRLLDKNPDRRNTAREVASALERCARPRRVGRSVGAILLLVLAVAGAVAGLLRRARAAEVERVIATADALAAGNDVAGAIREIAALVSRGADGPRQRAELAVLRTRERDVAGADAEILKALMLAPDDPEVICARGVVRLAHEDWKGALADADRALAATPDLVRAHRTRAVASFRLGRLDDALAASTRLTELAPTDPVPYVTRAGIALERADLVAARRDLERARALDPRDPAALYHHARLLRQLGDDDGARREADELLRVAPVDPGSHELCGELALTRDLEAAEKHIAKALALDPHYVNALMARASLRVRQGRPREATADLERVLEMKPRDLEALAALADVLANAGDLDRAIALLGDAVALRPGAPALRRSRALAYEKRRKPGDLLAAIEDLSVALERVETPLERGRILTDRATLFSDVDDDARGLVDAQRAVDLAPDLPGAWYTLAVMRVNTNDREGAIESAHRAASLFDEGSEGQAKALRLLEKLGAKR